LVTDDADIVNTIGDIPFIVVNEEKIEETLVDELSNFFEKLSVENDVSNDSSTALKRRNNDNDDDDDDEEPKPKKIKEDEMSSYCAMF
jgi:hypothetical protein